MSMRWSLDLALKTANYHKYYNRLDATVANMDSMIQSLLVTVDPHRGHEKPQPVLIKRLLNELGERMSAQYRSINYQIVGDSSLVINKPLWALTTILRNVLSNAWKYHVWDQAIQVQYSASSIIITNGVQDGNELDIESFWVPFWQWDTAWVAGHGLWLWVVQSLCSVYGWNTTITVWESNTLITTIQFI
jgi:signal transduction histidine kinase